MEYMINGSLIVWLTLSFVVEITFVVQITGFKIFVGTHWELKIKRPQKYEFSIIL